MRCPNCKLMPTFMPSNLDIHAKLHMENLQQKKKPSNLLDDVCRFPLHCTILSFLFKIFKFRPKNLQSRSENVEERDSDVDQAP